VESYFHCLFGKTKFSCSHGVPVLFKVRRIRVLKKMKVTTAGFAPLVLTAILTCSQTNIASDQKWLSFRCPEGQTVMAQFQLPEDQFVNVRFAGRELRLPHVISGSGARYSDGKTTFWNRGRSVLVEVDDKIVVQDCMLEDKPQG
jgi:membrane-bound inhibitor of C-type lysozyme